MRPKKSLPDESKELFRIGEYMLIEHILNKKPYFTVIRFYETSKGTRYETRGASGANLEDVKQEFERITGEKLKD